jgi:hypothetical protein
MGYGRTIAFQNDHSNILQRSHGNNNDIRGKRHAIIQRNVKLAASNKNPRILKRGKSTNRQQNRLYRPSRNLPTGQTTSGNFWG